jgi:predicted DnaQ family exonuclease/DinG family helicase
MPSIIAFDLETTGLDPKNDAIIEVALVKFDETGILERYTTLVNPGFPLPAESMNITGITDEDLKDAPFFSDIRPKLLEFLADGSPLLGHNVDFDLSFFREYGVDVGSRPLLDTFRIAEFLFFDAKSLNLGSLLESLGKSFGDQHRALADTEATVVLFEHCIEHMRAIKGNKEMILSYLAAAVSPLSPLSYVLKYAGFPRQSVSLDDIRRLTLSKRRAIPELAFFHDEKLDISWKDVLKAPKKETGLDRRPVSGVSLEERVEQWKMLDLTTSAFREKELLLIEAPTGVGKTFAYGIPSIITSIQTGKSVYISTNTKTLQDQIFEKDIPAMRELFRAQWIEDFSVTKIKWRSNYLSLFLFFEYLESDIREEMEYIVVAKLLFWLQKTEYGELDEISWYGQEYAILDRLRSNDRRVLIPENPYRKEEFLYRVRQDAKTANIIIINHALLLSETTEDAPSKILPDIKLLVIDEVHNLEAVATDALKCSTTLTQIEDALSSIDLIIKRQGQKNKPVAELFIFPELRDISESIVLNFGIVFDVLYRYLAFRVPQSGDNKYNQTLLESNFFKQDGVMWIGRILDALTDRIHELITHLYGAPEALYVQMDRPIAAIEGGLQVLQSICREQEKDFIKVITMKDGEVSASITPLHVGKVLDDKLYHSLDACIATSATLSVRGDFSYIEKSLSLQSFSKHILASDFDYSSQALLFIPSDIGDIKSSIDRERVNDFIGDIISIVRGRTLGLFTSFLSIKEVFLSINPRLKKEGITLMTQGLSGGRQRMIEYFREHSDSSVLFGTDSFWEGIDIPGKNLETLIIYKFPFAVPTDPVFIARSRLYRDSFSEYSLPAMIIKLRQWLGRLIRSKTDKGIIVLLDPRISSAWWEKVKEWFPEGIKIRSGTKDIFLEMLRKKKM